MHNYKQKLSNALDIPKAVLLDLTKISIIGNLQIYIENHKGIVEYKDDLVRLNVLPGQIIISGHNLTLKNIGLEDLYLEGQITDIQFTKD